MNYQDIVDAIVSTTENHETSFVANIPRFVRQAEEQIFNSVHLLDLRSNVVSNLIVGQQYVKLPHDFLAVYSLSVVDSDGKYHFLISKDVNFIREAYPDPNVQALPRHYGLFDGRTAIIAPTPDDIYKIELHQFYYPESIVTAGTSWLGSNFATVLLYGALVHAYIYMKGDDDMVAHYTTQFKESLGMLKRLADGMNRQDVYRSGQVVLPVT